MKSETHPKGAIDISEMSLEEIEERIRVSGTLPLSFAPPKHWRCKNRKRFIKLMMGEGVDSRRAESLARNIQIIQVAFGTGISYQEVWTRYLFMKGYIQWCCHGKNVD